MSLTNQLTVRPTTLLSLFVKVPTPTLSLVGVVIVETGPRQPAWKQTTNKVNIQLQSRCAHQWRRTAKGAHGVREYISCCGEYTSEL